MLKLVAYDLFQISVVRWEKVQITAPPHGGATKYRPNANVSIAITRQWFVYYRGLSPPDGIEHEKQARPKLRPVNSGPVANVFKTTRRLVVLLSGLSTL
ncbi:hypothetical protein M0804_013894 [Polistes exclamans]|nr:hypothetical protein M0804_013894 [Polistes exclamans]